MKLLWNDWVIFFGLLLYLGIGFMTKTVIAQIYDLEGIGEVAIQIEQNPEVRKAIDMGFTITQLTWIMVAIMVGIYVAFRIRRKKNDFGFDAFTIALFFLLVQNFFHDLPTFLMVMGI